MALRKKKKIDHEEQATTMKDKLPKKYLKGEKEFDRTTPDGKKQKLTYAKPSEEVREPKFWQYKQYNVESKKEYDPKSKKFFLRKSGKLQYNAELDLYVDTTKDKVLNAREVRTVKNYYRYQNQLASFARKRNIKDYALARKLFGEMKMLYEQGYITREDFEATMQQFSP